MAGQGPQGWSGWTGAAGLSGWTGPAGKRRHTGAIAFVIPLPRNPIWVRLQRGALQPAGDRGYVVMIMEEPGDPAMPPPPTGTWSGRAGPTACCWPPRCGTPTTPRGCRGVPGVAHVYVNRRGPDHGHDVVMDEPGAVRLFLEHAAGSGHRRVALIDGRPTLTRCTAG